MSISLPEALKELADQNRWVAWYDQDGRKIPKSVKTGNAKTNDPDTWGTFEQAAKTMDYKRYTGVGVMLGDGLIGIDLDHVIDPDGQIKDWAQKLIDQIGSYTEISPSGTGVHILAKADPKTVGMIGNADHRKGIEIYNHNRYFTLTGNQLNDNPLRDATEQVQQVMREHFPASSADDRVRRQVGAMARSQTRRMANQAMIANAGRDHVRFARVPSGGRTCAFCAMLASRGFVYHTAEDAALNGKEHQECHCSVIPGFDEDTVVEGYDPDALYEDYAKARDEAGDNPTTGDILAAMRQHDNMYSDGAIALARNDEIAGIIGQERMNGLTELINKSRHRQTAWLFASRFDEFRIVGTKLPKGARAHFSPKHGGVFVNVAEIDKDSLARPAYNTFVHECAHMLDRLLGGEREQYYSSSPIDGYALGVQLDADAENAVRERMKTQTGTSAERRRKAMQELVREINDQLGDGHDWSIHDMFQASLADGDDYSKLSNYGHRPGYFDTKGSQQCEAFAEMMAAQLTDEHAWRIMEKYFPQATKLFDLMVKEVAR